MTEHWCTYCKGVNTHNCQFNANVPRQHVYITNSTAQPAQAAPLLTEHEINSLAETHLKVEIETHVGETEPVAWVEGDFDFARAIEQAVRAKLRAGVPLTDAAVRVLWAQACRDHDTTEMFVRAFARAVEHHHGIVGKEGA